MTFHVGCLGALDYDEPGNDTREAKKVKIAGLHIFFRLSTKVG
jgi:hypothetical protein